MPMDAEWVTGDRRDRLAERVHDLPVLLNCPIQVEAMYCDRRAHIEEHSASNPILFLVLEGEGWMRIGGPDGETRAVRGRGGALASPLAAHRVDRGSGTAGHGHQCAPGT
jgi:hypothetical protein